MKVFAQLTKVDEEQRLIFARAAQETPDRSGEILDYETSKPLFQKWSNEQAEASGGKSYGNLRAMHGSGVAGILAEPIIFDDAERALDVVVKVVDDADWKKVLAGAYTGLSIGGSYAKRWKDGDLTRYTAAPAEISLVDRPCIPTAKFFDVRKADGSLSKMEFANMTENAAEVQVKGEASDVERLGELLNKNALSVADAIERLEKSLADAEPAEELKKSLFDVAKLAEIVQAIKYMADKAAYEANQEPDDSGIADRLQSLAADAAILLQDLAAHEAAEIVGGEDEAQPDGEVLAMSVKLAGLAKAGARNSAADAKTIQELHDLANKLGAACAAGNVGKTDEAEELQKADALTKAIDDATAPLKKRIAELEAQPQTADIALLAVDKGADAVQVQKTEIAPVIGITGEISETATLIKAARAKNLQIIN